MDSASAADEAAPTKKAKPGRKSKFSAHQVAYIARKCYEFWGSCVVESAPPGSVQAEIVREGLASGVLSLQPWTADGLGEGEARKKLQEAVRSVAQKWVVHFAVAQAASAGDSQADAGLASAACDVD